MEPTVTESVYNGFRRLDFTFAGKHAILVFPQAPDPKGRWLLKTEYFSAFPEAELEMVRRGWHLAYLENNTRWHVPADSENKAAFGNYLAGKYGLSKKCIPVGMSCGGLLAIYFAAAHPEHIAGLYLDAPVTNFLSCPGCFGASTIDAWDEFEQATGLTKKALLNYRNHPIDRVSALIAANIPVLLVSGDSDRTVPFDENGKYLYEQYVAAGAPIALHLKPGGDHHPHGLPDIGPIVRFCEHAYEGHPETWIGK